MATVEQISEKIAEYTKRFEYFPAVEKDHYPDPASPHDMKKLLEKYPNLIFSIDYRCYGTPKEVIGYVEKIGYSRESLVYYHDKDGVLDEDNEYHKDYLEEVEGYDQLHSEEVVLKNKEEKEVIEKVQTSETTEVSSEEEEAEELLEKEEEKETQEEEKEETQEEKETPKEATREEEPPKEEPPKNRELSTHDIPILEKGISYIVEEIKSRLPDFSSISTSIAPAPEIDNSKLTSILTSLEKLMTRIEAIESFHISIEEKLNSISEVVDSIDIASDVESSVSEIREELRNISDKLEKQQQQSLPTPPISSTRNTLSPRQPHRNQPVKQEEEEEYQSPISPKRNPYKNNRQVLFSFDNSMSRIRNI